MTDDHPWLGTPTHYEILEIDPGADETAVRDAYKRAKRVYSADSMVIYTLFTEADLEVLNERFDLAYEIISDPRTRREYDLGLHQPIPGSTADAISPPPPPPLVTIRSETHRQRAAPARSPSPRDLPIDDDMEFSGATLRRLREERGVELHELSDHTKISLMNLRFLEDMATTELPAPVYVRGFLRSVARYLRLPERQVVDSYMGLTSTSSEEDT